MKLPKQKNRRQNWDLTRFSNGNTLLKVGSLGYSGRVTAIRAGPNTLSAQPNCALGTIRGCLNFKPQNHNETWETLRFEIKLRYRNTQLFELERFQNRFLNRT